MTHLQPLPKQVLQKVSSSSSSFNFQYPLVSLRSSSSYLRLLSRLPVTSILPSIFPSIMCFVKQFLRKKCSILLASLLFIVSRMFLYSSTFSILHFSHDRSISILITTIQRHRFYCWCSKNKNVQRTESVVRTGKTRTAQRFLEGETLNDRGDGKDNFRLRYVLTKIWCIDGYGDTVSATNVGTHSQCWAFGQKGTQSFRLGTIS